MCARGWARRAERVLTIRAQAEAGLVEVEGYTEDGFVVGGVNFLGAVACLPSLAVLWDARGVGDISWDSLSLFHRVKSPPGPRRGPPASPSRPIAQRGSLVTIAPLPRRTSAELLLIGTGSRTRLIPPEVRLQFKKQGTMIDFMSSVRDGCVRPVALRSRLSSVLRPLPLGRPRRQVHAASTFNLLAREGRRVGCALLPVVEEEMRVEVKAAAELQRSKASGGGPVRLPFLPGHLPRIAR